MRAEPRTILNFLAIHFEVIRDIYDIQCKDGFIRVELLNEVLSKYDKDVIAQLTDYKILRKKGSDYEFHSIFFNLIEFIQVQFKPLLPETIEKYYLSIKALYERIIESVRLEKNILVESILSLANEIRDFLEHIERNTYALLQETRDLKSNIEQIPYSEKIRRASFWIEEYINPMNLILDVNHSQSVVNKLYEISSYVNQKRLNFEDENIRLKFEQLYSQILFTNDALLEQSKILNNELLPLIERIRTESLILTGFIEFLNQPYKIPPPFLFKPSIKGNPYSMDFYLTAKAFFERVIYDEPAIFEEDKGDFEKWVFNKAIYKSKLKEELPQESFFLWCSNTLKSEFQSVETDKYFSLINLLFEDDFDVDFSNQTEEIETNDKKLIVPTIKIL